MTSFGRMLFKKPEATGMVRAVIKLVPHGTLNASAIPNFKRTFLRSICIEASGLEMPWRG